MEDKVWFTYKARIQAHARLSWLDFHSQLILVWYAMLSAGLAVVTIRYPRAIGNDTDVLSAVLSIALLGISMAVANRDFRGRAIAMRQNYLDLQKLYDQLKRNDSHTSLELERYHSLLSAVENHKEIDDKIFRVLHSKGLRSRHPTCGEAFESYFYLTFRLAATLALYFAPILMWLLR